MLKVVTDEQGLTPDVRRVMEAAATARSASALWRWCSSIARPSDINDFATTSLLDANWSLIAGAHLA